LISVIMMSAVRQVYRRVASSESHAGRCISVRCSSSSSITLLFTTPLWRTDLSSRLGAATNTALARSIRQQFFRVSSRSVLSLETRAAYEHEAANRSDEADPLASAANNEFFQYQIDRLTTVHAPDSAGAPALGGDLLLESFASREEFRTLAGLIREQAARFLHESFALPAEDAAALVSARRMLLWASLHADGSAHPYHTHDDAMLSGVYFVDAPEGAGEFVVGSALPPLTRAEHRVTPRAGTLLLFPPSTAHRVSPSRCASRQPRISISFNLEGAWEEAPAAHVHLDPIEAEAYDGAESSSRHVASVERAVQLEECVRGQRSAASGTQPETAEAMRGPQGRVQREPSATAGAPVESFTVDKVAEADAVASFAEMAKRLMRNPERKRGGYGKRPAGMPERRTRG
jgi:hypothetical protein